MVLRVAMLQTVNRSTYAAYGESKRLSTVTLTASRGTIYDRNRLELAISAPQKTIWADPRLVLAPNVADPEGNLEQLAAALNLSPFGKADLRQRLNIPKKDFAYVARQVDDATADRVLALKLPGIFAYAEPKRFNPGDLALSTVGHTDIDGIGAEGSGIEKVFDSLLTGIPGTFQREVDVNGRTIPVGHHELIPAQPGKSLVLTIDSTLTYEVEQMLLDHLNGLRAKGSATTGGMVTVLDRTTGDVLALASVSTDPTTKKLQINQGANRPLLEAFEPGSVMKIVPAAGALDSGASLLDTSWHLDSLITSGDDEIHNAELSPTRDRTLREIVVESDNVGVVKLAQAIGPTKLESYLRSFGFGAKTPIDFPDESTGILPPNSKWYGSQKDTIAYGQGVSITQVQLAAAMNTIANSGTYVAPRLLSATIDPDGTVHDQPVVGSHRVISEQAAADMTDALRGVVCEKSGTVGSHHDTYMNLPAYSVAGKTGTAYKAQNKGRVVGYDKKGHKKIDNYMDETGERHYMASFAGFLPANDPRLTIAVTIDEPTGPFRFGASGAAPLFAKIGAEAMRLLSVPPSPEGTGCVAPTK